MTQERSTLARDQPDDRDQQHGDQEEQRFQRPLGQPLEFEDPLEVDRDGDEKQPGQRRRGTGDGDEEVLPLRRVIGEHG
jgi:hypothetical protein